MKPSERSLFVVGDDAQSIYGFRGSKMELILNFHQHYPQLREIVLNQNYRSTQPILDLAENILTLNPKQKKKQLFTQKAESYDVHFYLARNERDEAECIVRILSQLYLATPQQDEVYTDSEVRFVSDDEPVSTIFDLYDSDFDSTNHGSSYFTLNQYITKQDWSKVEQLNNCAVLYRTHAQSRVFEETFLKHGLPYKLVSGTRFLDRKEIRDVVSILKFASNGEDAISFSRFFPLISVGVGPKSVAQILESIRNPELPLKPKHAEARDRFVQTLHSLWQKHTSIIEFTKSLLEDIGYTNYLRRQYPEKEEYLARLENIGELYSLMYDFDQTQDSLSTKLAAFLAEVTLLSNQDDNPNDTTPKISLMSLHQSKGLEFETVFLVGIEDGLLPHLNSLTENDGIEEEIRLAYVGVTRAKHHLYLLAAESRLHYGIIQANQISRIFRSFLNTHTKRMF